MTFSDFSGDCPAHRMLERKIVELSNKKYLPENMVSLVTEVARLQLAAEGQVRFAGLAEQVLPQALLEKLPSAAAQSQGVSLLRPESFPLDMESVEKLFHALLRLFAEKAPQLAPQLSEIAETVRNEAHFLEDRCHELLACTQPAGFADTGKEHGDAVSGTLSFFAEWERKHPEAPSLFYCMLRSAVMPSLTVAARLLGEQQCNKEKVWQHGHCPVCGSLPLIGRLEDGAGLRTHTCSFCSYEYRVPRIGCPFCLATDHAGTEYCTTEEEPGYAIDVCKNCNNYIKIADFRQYDRAWSPLLDDLASLLLDLHARQMGYTRPTLSAWGF